MGKQSVAAPPATAPRYSLLFCASQVPDQNADKWIQGIQWISEQFVGGGLVDIECDGSTSEMQVDGNGDLTGQVPFNVYAEDHCSTLASLARDFEARARRQLEATQSHWMARELWLGQLSAGEALGNPWLTEDPHVLTSAPISPDEALALLDIALAQMLGGRIGMIHVSPQILDLLQEGKGLIQRQTAGGLLWTTSMGTTVVADSGYPGTGPDNLSPASTNQWMYGTPAIQYRLGAVEILGDPKGSGVNKPINFTTVWAQRPALLQWDSNVPAGDSKLGVVAAETDVEAFDLGLV